MKIAVVGSGYVGLVTGACFAELGVETVCVDIDEQRIAMLKRAESPIFEENLPDLLSRNIDVGRLRFTSDIASAVVDSRVIFVCVNTPANEEGAADLSDVFEVVRQVAAAVNDYKVVVTKSTVPVGTGRKIVDLLHSLLPSDQFDVASNPEFLSEGTAVKDFMSPSRVVIGVESERAKSILAELYLPLSLGGASMLYTNLETAELIKYSANAFLATKITFINEIADLCEQTGVDIRALAHGIGLDERIGNLYLRPSPGYGGLCFPKDTLALIHTAKNAGAPVRIIETVVEINHQRKIRMAHRIIRACGGSVKGKTIAMLGLTFKPNTDDLRDSSSVAIIEELQRQGAKIHAHDPKGMAVAKAQLGDINYFEQPYDAIARCDAAVIATAWPQYAELDAKRLLKLLAQPVLVDLHNVFEAQDMLDAGFDYQGVGQGQVMKSRPDTEYPLEPLSRKFKMPKADRKTNVQSEGKSILR